MTYEYRVIPAPRTGLARKGLKKTPDKFANHLETVMNENAAEGWEFVRAETLPCEERVGIKSRVEKFQNMLVFRRAKPDAARANQSAPEAVIAAPAPAAEAPEVVVTPAPAAQDAPAEDRTPPREAPVLRAQKDAPDASDAPKEAAAQDTDASKDDSLEKQLEEFAPDAQGDTADSDQPSEMGLMRVIKTTRDAKKS